MKNNLISAIAGWKSAALLALVAMVAAVAFSGVLTTNTADAQVPGQTVTVTFLNVGGNVTDEHRFRIDPGSEGSATFAANGSTNLRCVDDNALCDLGITGQSDGTEGGTYSQGTIVLSVTIDGDSPAPADIFVQRVTRGSGNTAGTFIVSDEQVISVKRSNPVTGIGLAAAPPAPIPANPAAPATTPDAENPDPHLRAVTVKATDSRGFGLGAESLTVITTRGALETDGNGNCAAADSSTAAALPNPRSSCTISTSEDDATKGLATVKLAGNGASGVASVTFLHGATGTSFVQEVVIYGTVASISAEAEQSAINVGGSTFIVVTALDSGGNPVAGASIDVDTADVLTQGIVSPGAPPSQVKVRANNTTDKIVGTALPLVLLNIPACGDDLSKVDPTPEDTTNGDETSRYGAGTNSAGKCVIQVNAPNGASPEDGGTGTLSPADDATRGTHTITIKAAALVLPTQKVSVDITVGGPPTVIETDAPTSVDPLSSTAITVTVLDDEGERVGAVPISVVQVDGSGNLDVFRGQTSDPTTSTSKTSDGRATFTYLAPLSAGEAVFLVRVGSGPGQIQDTITVAVGAAAEEDPEAPAATWNNELVSGQNVVVWNGDDGADASAGSADGVTAIWSYNTGSGSWDGYFPEAADVPGGNTLTTLSSNQAYVVIVN